MHDRKSFSKFQNGMEEKLSQRNGIRIELIRVEITYLKNRAPDSNDDSWESFVNFSSRSFYLAERPFWLGKNDVLSLSLSLFFHHDGISEMQTHLHWHTPIWMMRLTGRRGKALRGRREQLMPASQLQ